ncbi:MAG: hypothetical protein AAB388_03900 [Patescibacteria group bacterium]
MTVGLVIIDPQNCFMDLPGAPLPVKGATADMEHLSVFITSNYRHIDEVQVSFDTHPFDHISHTNRWIDRDGNHPAPFTIITSEAYERGDWLAAKSTDQWWQGQYLKLLKRPHCIWPIHGQESEWEWQMHDGLRRAVFLLIDRCMSYRKGRHRDTEQFGIFGADVPFPGAPETEINMELIEQINRHDCIIFAGEASSHCVMDSVNQFIAHTPDRDHKKIVVLRDCMSPVPQAPGGPDFPKLAADWLTSLQSIDVNVITSTELTL